jgi:hypothetical protein
MREANMGMHVDQEKHKKQSIRKSTKNRVPNLLRTNRASEKAQKTECSNCEEQTEHQKKHKKQSAQIVKNKQSIRKSTKNRVPNL